MRTQRLNNAKSLDPKALAAREEREKARKRLARETARTEMLKKEKAFPISASEQPRDPIAEFYPTKEVEEKPTEAQLILELHDRLNEKKSEQEKAKKNAKKILKRLKNDANQYEKRIEKIQQQLSDNLTDRDLKQQIETNKALLENYNELEKDYKQSYERFMHELETQHNWIKEVEPNKIDEIRNQYVLIQEKVGKLKKLILEQGECLQSKAKEEADAAAAKQKRLEEERLKQAELVGLTQLELEAHDYLRSLALDNKEDADDEEKQFDLKAEVPDNKSAANFSIRLSAIASHPENQQRRKDVEMLINEAKLEAENDKKAIDDLVLKTNLEPTALSTIIIWLINNPGSASHDEYTAATQQFQPRCNSFKPRWDESTEIKTIESNILKIKQRHITASEILTELSTNELTNNFLSSELKNGQITITANLMLAMLQYIGNCHFFPDDPKKDLQAKKTRAIKLFKCLIPKMEMEEVLSLGKELIEKKDDMNYSYIRQERGWQRFFWEHGNTNTWKELMVSIQGRVVYLNTNSKDAKDAKDQREATPINQKQYMDYYSIMNEKTSFFACLSIFPPSRKPRQADGKIDINYQPRS